MTDAAQSRSQLRVLAPDWHAAEIGPPCTSIEDALATRYGSVLRRAARKLPLLRGLLIYRVARRFDRVGLVQKSPGSLTFTVLEAWIGRRRDRLVLLTFLPREPSRRPLVNLALRARFVLIERPAVRRAMRAGHVLTPSEQSRYAARYRVPRARFHLIRWALSARGEAEVPDRPRPARVVSSGRASCDWETLFAAARRASWPLTVICGARDGPRVHALNHDGRAQVFVELSHQEHDRILRESAIYVLCLRDEGPSAGHVRLLAAVDAGLAVVASDVPGLIGYVEPEVCTVVVPPGDPSRLATAIDSLIADPDRRAELARRAAARASQWTYDDMWGALRRLLTEE